MTHGSQEQQQQQSPEVPAEALIKPGDRLPLDEINFQVLGDDNKPKTLSGQEVFGGKRVAVICIPGAFTPVCSSRHVPGYATHQQELLSQGGVDTIACVAVNDPFVMESWRKTFPPDCKVLFLADSQLDLARNTGLHTELWSTTRLRRFSMLVDDGVVTALCVEPRNENLGVSSAEHMLQILKQHPKEQQQQQPMEQGA